MINSDLRAPVRRENKLNTSFRSETTTVVPDSPIPSRLREHPAIFAARFSRCRSLLHFIACRVLGGAEGAEDAVENCWLTASRNPPKFEYESACRSWLLRVLIDEALAILQAKAPAPAQQSAISQLVVVAAKPLYAAKMNADEL